MTDILIWLVAVILMIGAIGMVETEKDHREQSAHEGYCKKLGYKGAEKAGEAWYCWQTVKPWQEDGTGGRELMDERIARDYDVSEEAVRAK